MYDFSKSDFILMIGGQIIFFVLLILVVYFGMDPLKSFPYADDVRSQVKLFLTQQNKPSATNAK
jgi:methylglyoxal synthase